MSALISKMLIFVTLMLIGYLGARAGALSEEFTKAASRLTINVFMIATIVNSVISDTPEISGAEVWKALLLSFAVVISMYLLAIPASRLIREDEGRKGQVMLLIAVVNNMFVGLPVAEQLYGNTAVFYMALTNIPYNIMLYTLGVWKLNDSEMTGMSVKRMISPPLLGTLAAVVIFAADIPMPGIIKDLCTVMSGATLPLSMIMVGASLGRVNLMSIFRERSIYPVSAIRLIAAPLLAAALMRVLGIDGALAGTMIIFASCPTGIVVTILSIEYCRDSEYSSSAILLSTVLSMVTIPLAAYFLL